MRLAAVLALACLAGCATTPEELQKDGHRYEFQSAKTSREAAMCVARNMENDPAGSVNISMRERETPGTWQILWTVPSHGMTLGLILIDPAQGGALIKMFLTNGPKGQYDLRAAQFSNGC